MKTEQYPKVSVVISTYDRPAMLDRALASVHAQTFDDFEVVIVDDYSPPDGNTPPPEYLKVLEKWDSEFEKRDIPIFYYRLPENSGYQCRPKNIGVEKSAGDYIAYLDDDNTWRPNHLEVLVKAIESDFSHDMVYGRVCYKIEDEELRKQLFEQFGRHPYPDGDAAGTEWNPSLLNQMNFVDTSTMLHSKGAFWRLVRETDYGWDETLRRFGDWNFVWRWACVGNNAKLVDEVTLDYNVHRGSVQIYRPATEVPVCYNYAQYQGVKKHRETELSVVS